MFRQNILTLKCIPVYRKVKAIKRTNWKAINYLTEYFLIVLTLCTVSSILQTWRSALAGHSSPSTVRGRSSCVAQSLFHAGRPVPGQRAPGDFLTAAGGGTYPVAVSHTQESENHCDQGSARGGARYPGKRLNPLVYSILLNFLLISPWIYVVKVNTALVIDIYYM